MDAFADYDAYVELYDTDADEDRVNALLARASRDVAAELRAAGIDWAEPDEDFASDLSDVVCAMVRRALGEGDEFGIEVPFGASQVSQTGGPYSLQATLSNPYGDLFITESERRKLGIGLPRACVLSPY
ncbi:Gp19/Gp15/Gp42 family protein [Bifidobacterium sp.]|uniref:Gp19/Gp15/Gp42 family protein n=1 Tax=Bifidobacterium sp. TaxID=41200 RepID=UPI003867DED1